VHTSLIVQHLIDLNPKGQGRTTLVVILAIMSRRLRRNQSCSSSV